MSRGPREDKRLVNRFDEAMLQLGVAQRSIDWCNHTPVLQAAFDMERHETWTG
jgi:hypothetical protein